MKKRKEKKKRIIKKPTPEQLALRRYRSQSHRMVLVLECDLSEDQRRHIIHQSKRLREYKNYIIRKANNRIEQIFRRRDYRQARKDYGKLKDSEDPKDQEKLKEVKQILQEVPKQEKLNSDELYKTGSGMLRHLGLPSVFGLSVCKDVYRAAEKILYGKSKKRKLDYVKNGEYPSLQAKNILSAIRPKVIGGELVLETAFAGRIKLKVKEKDSFAQEVLERMIEFLQNSKSLESQAVKTFEETGEILDTFRICYVTFVIKEIRGKLRIFAHFTLEAESPRKRRTDGSSRHQYGTGKLGIDWGIQSFAVVGDGDVIGLQNLAERNEKSTLESEKKEAEILQAIERSRRATNPENYNDDGTVKKGRKYWNYSKRYKRLQSQLKNLRRKNSINRKLAINESVNKIRSLGDTVIIEAFDGETLKRKARFDEENPNRKRKRFGHSIHHRSPGYFNQRLKEVFCSTGGRVLEVKMEFRASQYDHKADAYRKKELSERVHQFEDGEKVQRDLYSAFLLYCASEDLSSPDRKTCLETYERFLFNHNQLVGKLKAENRVIMNAGLEQL